MVKLTPDLIQQSMQYINPVRDRELDLRGNIGVDSILYNSVQLRHNRRNCWLRFGYDNINHIDSHAPRTNSNSAFNLNRRIHTFVEFNSNIVTSYTCC